MENLIEYSTVLRRGNQVLGGIKFAQSELDPAKQKAGYHHHDGTLPLFVSVYRSEWSFRRITDKQKNVPGPFLV